MPDVSQVTVCTDPTGQTLPASGDVIGGETTTVLARGTVTRAEAEATAVVDDAIVEADDAWILEEEDMLDRLLPLRPGRDGEGGDDIGCLVWWFEGPSFVVGWA